MSIRPEPIYIVAATIAAAKAAAIDRGLPPSPWTREWAWVHEPNVLRGQRGARVVLGPGYHRLRDWPEIEAHLAFLDVEYVE